MDFPCCGSDLLGTELDSSEVFTRTLIKRFFVTLWKYYRNGRGMEVQLFAIMAGTVSLGGLYGRMTRKCESKLTHLAQMQYER